MNGPTVLKHCMMEQLGWRVLHVRYWEWNALEGDDQAKVKYCRPLLEQARGVGTVCPHGLGGGKVQLQDLADFEIMSHCVIVPIQVTNVFLFEEGSFTRSIMVATLTYRLREDFWEADFQTSISLVMRALC